MTSGPLELLGGRWTRNELLCTLQGYLGFPEVGGQAWTMVPVPWFA